MEQNIEHLIRCLRTARDSISPDITVQRLIVLLCVAEHPGYSQSELGKTMHGISTPALSRNLADLSSTTSRKLPGPALIRQRTDSHNLRRKQLYLTAKGERLVLKLKSALVAD